MALHYDHGKWQNNRPIFLKVGLALGIAFCIFIFQLEVQSTPIKPYVFDLFEFDELINTPRTKEVKKPVPPPPPPKPKSFIIEPVDDPEPVSKPEVIPEEKNLDDKNIIDEPAVAYYEPTPEPAPIAAPVVEEVDDKVYDFVDRMPCYESCFDDENPITRKRCTDKILMEQIYETLRYPIMAKSNDISGTVVASFTVTKTGEISDVKILRDIGGGCGQAVVKALKTLDQMMPGKKEGRPVNVSYKMPVKFVLN